MLLRRNYGRFAQGPFRLNSKVILRTFCRGESGGGGGGGETTLS